MCVCVCVCVTPRSNLSDVCDLLGYCSIIDEIFLLFAMKFFALPLKLATFIEVILMNCASSVYESFLFSEFT